MARDRIPGSGSDQEAPRAGPPAQRPSYAGASPAVFISYAHDHLAPRIAGELFRYLESRGGKPWIDRSEIRAGADWALDIERAIERAHVVVALLTRDAVAEGSVCRRELGFAERGRRPIIPVLLEPGVQVPLHAAEGSYIDLTAALDPGPERERKFAEIWEAIEAGQVLTPGGLTPLDFSADVESETASFEGREWLLEEVGPWLGDAKGRHVFWLRGGPGVGKSAIACWLSSRLPQAEPAADTLLHLFDFVGAPSGGRGEISEHESRRNVVTCLKSLAGQLCALHPPYAAFIRRHLWEIAGLGRAKEIPDLFRLLFVAPFAGRGRVADPERPVVVILDALDRANTEGARMLAECLAGHESRLPGWLRALVTSRDEPGLLPPSTARVYELDPTSDAQRADVERYLSARIDHLDEGPVRSQLRDRFPDLVRASEGNLLYCRLLMDESERKGIQWRVPRFPEGLDRYYAAWLDRHFPGESAYYEQTIRPGLELVSLARAPVSLRALGRFLGWSDPEAEARRFADAVHDLFPVHDGYVQLAHRSVPEWLMGNEAGDKGFSRRAAESRLVACLWADYDRGPGCRQRYTLCHLPFHLRQARQWERLTKVLRDQEFLAEWEPNPYRRNLRYERGDWQQLLEGLVEHFDAAGEPSDAQEVVATLFFDEFWWWGEYLRLEYCGTLAEMLGEVAPASQEFAQALLQFDEAYPRLSEHLFDRDAAGGQWRQVREALETLRQGVAREGDGGTDRDALHLRALVDLYLAEALQNLGDYPGADALYAEALGIVTGPTKRTDSWCESWLRQRVAELRLAEGRSEEARKECLDGLEVVEDPDHEVKSNLYRVLGDIDWQRGEWPRACAAYDRALLYSTLFQADPPPPDAYTVTHLKEITTRIAARLQQCPDPDLRDRWCGDLLTYWRQWRLGGETAPLTQDAWTQMAAADPAVLREKLFPMTLAPEDQATADHIRVTFADLRRRQAEAWVPQPETRDLAPKAWAVAVFRAFQLLTVESPSGVALQREAVPFYGEMVRRYTAWVTAQARDPARADLAPRWAAYMRRFWQRAWRVACCDEACPWDNGLQPDRNLPGWEATPGVSELARWLTGATEEAVALGLCPPTPLPAESAACAGALAAAAESLLDKARRLELEIDLHGLAD